MDKILFKKLMKDLLKESLEIEIDCERGHLLVNIKFDDEVIFDDQVMVSYEDWLGATS